MSREDIIAFAFFVLIIGVTLVITYWASKRNVDTSHHYVAGGEIKGWQNGLAIAGDYLSAASFLGIAGAIALSGFSGFYLSIGFLVAYLTVLLLVAEPLRNLGKYTVGDALTARFNTRTVRSASALNTVAISMFYMIAQLIGAGALISLLLPISFNLAIIIVGILMTLYVVAGGMIATTWIQIIKAVLLILGSIGLSLAVLAQFGFNPIALFNAVQSDIGREAVIPAAPSGLTAGLDSISLNIALVLGTAGLPHILIRFLTVPDAKRRGARSSWRPGSSAASTSSPRSSATAPRLSWARPDRAGRPRRQPRGPAARRGPRRSDLPGLYLGGGLRDDRGRRGRPRHSGLRRLRPTWAPSGCPCATTGKERAWGPRSWERR
jgi:cation/acetate symporter